MHDDLIRRLRRGLWLYVVIALASVAGDLLTRRPDAGVVDAIRGIGIVACLVGLALLPTVRTAAAGFRLVQWLSAVVVAAGVAQDAITRDPYSTPLLVAMLSLATAVAIPWRWQDQLVVVATGSAGVLANWAIVGGPAYLRFNTLLASLGSVVVALLVERERTALEESRRRASASEARLRQIADHAREVFWTLELAADRLPELSYLSPGAFRLLGMTPGAAGREALLQRIHPEDRDRLSGLFALAGQVRAPGAVDFRILTAQGEVRAVQARFAPIREADGTLVRLGGVLEDVTTERQAAAALAQARDEAEATARARTQFLAGMSHEISTPLTAILGTLDLVRDTGASAAQRRRWETIRTSAQSLHLLLSDVLDFSKSEAGELRLHPTRFDVGELVAGIVELHAARARASGLDLRFEAHGPLLAEALGDAGRLRQVLNNLVSNAIKFTPAGEVCVRLAPAAAGMVRFEVTDTGIGVPAASQARIFQPFTQADASIASRFGGNGLGLTIAARLVEGMGGAIGVDSAGQGSCFWFTVPLAAPAADDAGGGLEGGCVVVVAADQSAGTALVEHLRGAGAAGRWFADPAAAAAWLTANAAGVPGDAAVLLVVEPAGLGAEAMVRALLGGRSAPARPPILVLARAGRGGDSAVAAESGATAWVAAPVRSETLAARLRACWTKPAAKLAPRAGGFRRGRVLVVDDSDVVRAVTRELLRRLGQEVETVAGGAEALARLAAHPFDLVLLDCQMPEMDGFETARRIRAGEDGSGRRLPIVAFSAGAPEIHRDRCLAAGMDDCLAKPIAPGALQGLLARWLPSQAPTGVAIGPACDRERLAELAGHDGGAVRRYGDLFIREARDVVAAVRAAAGGAAAPDLREAIHRARGAAAYVGAVRFEAALAGVGEAGGDLLRLASLAEDLASALDDFEHALRELERDLTGAAARSG
ncbi:MAG: ATP-binding protein [Candidatus Binatia bacterium]